MTDFLLNFAMCAAIFAAGTYGTMRVWDYLADR